MHDDFEQLSSHVRNLVRATTTPRATNTQETKVERSHPGRREVRRSSRRWQNARGILISQSGIDVLQSRDALQSRKDRGHHQKDLVPMLDPASLDYLCAASCSSKAAKTEFFELVAPVVGDAMLRHQRDIVAYFEHKTEMAANAKQYERERKKLSYLSEGDVLFELDGTASKFYKVDAVDAAAAVDESLETQLPRLPKLSKDTKRGSKDWLDDLVVRPESRQEGTSALLDNELATSSKQADIGQ